MWQKLFCVLFLLLLPLSAGYSQSSDLSIREQAQSELLTLKTQLLSCQKAINGLKKDIKTLKIVIANYEEITNSLEKQLEDLSQELEMQTALYAKLSKQSEDLRKYITQLETERSWLIVGIVGAGLATAGAVIWAATK